MKKLICLLVIVLVVFNYSAFSSDNTFVKGQRSDADLSRDKLSKGPDIVALAGLTKGMTVADVLGGTGYYSETLKSILEKTLIVN